ncbi:MAG: hypothetical protein K6T30_05940 [Alicyclobacillus sp.]|nr:hypothetical protein [Alicyclobacillus sp.]
MQLALLSVPFVMLVSRTPWASIGFSLQRLVPSLRIGAGYSLLYLILMVAATRLGAHVSHFDGARHQLGLPLVLLMYVPFWGVLESVWMAFTYTVIDRWVTRRTARSWPGLVVAGLWFGVLHAVIQVVLYHQPWTTGLEYIAVGVLFIVAGSILKLTGNAWGMTLFWTVSNF